MAEVYEHYDTKLKDFDDIQKIKFGSSVEVIGILKKSPISDDELEIHTKKIILIASGAEVTLAMKIKQELLKNFIEARIVSMPNINELLREKNQLLEQLFYRHY